MFRVVNCIRLLFIYMLTVVDQLPRLGKREFICLLLFTCNYVVSVWRGFLFLWVLWMGYVILLWHSLILSYNYFLIVQGANLTDGNFQCHISFFVYTFSRLLDFSQTLYMTFQVFQNTRSGHNSAAEIFKCGLL